VVEQPSGDPVARAHPWRDGGGSVGIVEPEEITEDDPGVGSEAGLEQLPGGERAQLVGTKPTELTAEQHEDSDRVLHHPRLRSESKGAELDRQPAGGGLFFEAIVDTADIGSDDLLHLRR
jgi:hypothetical protein